MHRRCIAAAVVTLAGPARAELVARIRPYHHILAAAAVAALDDAPTRVFADGLEAATP